jgi:dTDP-4-dehydrorhamnose 3,5-epimerase
MSTSWQPVKSEATDIPGVVIIHPDVYTDERGVFFETWSQARYANVGVPETFVQDNVSRSSRGVLRGLHYQLPHAQGKLLSVLEGEIFDVAVDIRRGSPSYGKWVGVTLSSTNHVQLYVPAGCAHGFQALSDEAVVLYKCTEYYHHNSDHSVLWSDSDLAIPWALPPLLSAKDRVAPRLSDVPKGELPMYSLS